MRASRSSSGHGEVLALELRSAREQLGREQQELAACRRQLAEVQAQQQRAVEQLAGLQVRGGEGSCVLAQSLAAVCVMLSWYQGDDRDQSAAWLPPGLCMGSVR